MSNKDETEFSIPENFIKQLYEFSGGADKNKGIIIALCSENGSPTIYSRHESLIIELGLKKALEDFLDDTIELIEKDSK
ncbi:MAG: hypothetical protein HWN81_02100 [Candidatus Lokiarchaeota archaeon]|nr:hypothetical protein [Candidatus Lokiarchaeota archaeon]